CRLALHSFPTRRSSDLARLKGDATQIEYDLRGEFAVRFVVAHSLGWIDAVVHPVNALERHAVFAMDNTLGVLAYGDYGVGGVEADRKSTRLNSSHVKIP